jgi:hypothetical protein
LSGRFVGAALFAPIPHLTPHAGDLICALAALGGIGIVLGTFVGLLISEYTPLFGFMESGYRLAVLLTLVFDVLTIAFLGLFLFVRAPRLVTTITTEWRTP